MKKNSDYPARDGEEIVACACNLLLRGAVEALCRCRLTLESIEDVERGVGMVGVGVGVRWGAGHEVGQRREGRELVDVVYHVRQSGVDHRLRVEAGVRAHAATVAGCLGQRREGLTAGSSGVAAAAAAIGLGYHG